MAFQKCAFYQESVFFLFLFFLPLFVRRGERKRIHPAAVSTARIRIERDRADSSVNNLKGDDLFSFRRPVRSRPILRNACCRHFWGPLPLKTTDVTLTAGKPAFGNRGMLRFLFPLYPDGDD